MGVVYKLTEDVVQFIIKQKQELPQLSCRELVEQIAVQFQKKVSKSAVHEILKEANIVSPRGRKARPAFAIPKEKKEQLFVPPVLALPGPQPTPQRRKTDPQPIIMPSQAQDKVLNPLNQAEETMSLADALLRMAFYDLFPKPWRGIRNAQELMALPLKELQEELLYRSTAISGFKLDLEDGCSIFIDNLMQYIDSNVVTDNVSYVVVEKALGWMADYLQNNIQPIVIKRVKESCSQATFFDFLSAIAGKKDKQINQISLLDASGSQLIDFKGVMNFRRNLVIGVSMQDIEDRELINNEFPLQHVHLIGEAEPKAYLVKNTEIAGMRWRGIKLLDQHMQPVQALLSNMPDTVSSGDIVRLYFARHPVCHVDGNNAGHGGGIILSQDPLMTHLLRITQAGIDENSWNLLKNTQVSCRANDSVFIINYLLTDSCVNLAALISKIDALNVRGIQDYEGKIIYIKSLTS